MHGDDGVCKVKVVDAWLWCWMHGDGIGCMVLVGALL